MSDKTCPLMLIAWDGRPGWSNCTKNRCTFYDEHAQQCSQVSQAMALRDIAEQLKRNADAMMDYSPAKEPTEVELQPILKIHSDLMACVECVNSTLSYEKDPCRKCVSIPGLPDFKRKS